MQAGTAIDKTNKDDVNKVLQSNTTGIKRSVAKTVCTIAAGATLKRTSLFACIPVMTVTANSVTIQA